ERADHRVADIGAVEGDEQRPGAGQPRAPAGQAVVGVDEVEAAAAQQRPQAAGRRQVLAAAGREAEHLHLDPATAHLLDLVAHPAAALRRRVVGLEVGHDQHAHAAQRTRGAPFAGELSPNWHTQVWRCDPRPPSIGGATRERRESMLYALLARVHAFIAWRLAAIRRLAGEHGQGTVEYVGLILLVSLLMVGMVAAMKGFNGKQGTELADVIVNKIKEAVGRVAFK